MKYELRNCRDGSKAVYPTTVEISEKDDVLTFHFVCENSRCHCPYKGYNQLHSEGDAVELLIGTDPARRVYYEIELAPSGDSMLAEMEYLGEDEKNEPILVIHFVEDSFIKTSVSRTGTGYEAEISFDKKSIFTGDGEIYFNAYRLDTDGVETDRHLFALNPTMRHKFHTPEKYVFLKDYYG